MSLRLLAIGIVVCSLQSFAPAVNLAGDLEYKKFQGEWTDTNDENGNASFTKRKLEFKHSKTGEWYTGEFEVDATTKPKTMTVKIHDCAIDDFKGKVSIGIYRFVDGKLEITANRPGQSDGPKGFDDEKARHMILKRK